MTLIPFNSDTPGPTWPARWSCAMGLGAHYVRTFTTRHLLILRNHGTLTVGCSVASAFYRLYALEWACAAQVRTLSMGREVRLPTQEFQDKQALTMGSTWVDPFAEQRFWPAMLRKAERECPGFDD